MKQRNKKKAGRGPRNPVVVALLRRYGNTVTTMRDRRETRGGATNRQRDILADN